MKKINRLLALLLLLGALLALVSCGSDPKPTDSAVSEEASADQTLSLPPMQEGESLIINELIAANSKFYPVDGEYYDLIEIKNNGTVAVELSDYFLSDKEKNLLKWRLPQTELAPGGFYVAIASGNGDAHANFKVSSDKETVYLTRGDGQTVDSINAEDIPPNVSLGRTDDGFAYFDTPSFGEENGVGKTRLLTAPNASVETGLYRQGFSVELEGEGTIYYTLDGSKPTEKDKIYDSPIEIKKTCTLRAVCMSEDSVTSPVSSFVYHVKEATYDFDVLQLSLDPADFYGDDGIYTQYEERWEKEANLTYIVDGKAEFSIDCGLKLVGDGSRSIAKKNFQVKFRGEYGSSSLEYAFFGEDGMQEQDALMLRSGSEDFNRALFRDEMLNEVITENCDTLLVQHYVPVNLYVNDEYFGIYFIKERINEQFVAHFLNCNEDDIDLIKTRSELESGDISEWNALLAYIVSHDLSDDGAYNLVAEQLNLESIADWYIFRSYFGDRDSHNIRYFRQKDGKWHASLFDFDWAMNTQEGVLTNLVTYNRSDNIIIRGLLQNDRFVDFYLNRLNYYLEKCLNDTYMLDKINQFEALFSNDVIYDRNVWCRSSRRWSSYVTQLKEYIRKGSLSRTDILLTDIQDLFNLSGDEMYEIFAW